MVRFIFLTIGERYKSPRSVPTVRFPHCVRESCASWILLASSSLHCWISGLLCSSSQSSSQYSAFQASPMACGQSGLCTVWHRGNISVLLLHERQESRSGWDRKTRPAGERGWWRLNLLMATSWSANSNSILRITSDDRRPMCQARLLP